MNNKVVGNVEDVGVLRLNRVLVELEDIVEDYIDTVFVFTVGNKLVCKQDKEELLEEVEALQEEIQEVVEAMNEDKEEYLKEEFQIEYTEKVLKEVAELLVAIKALKEIE